MTENADGSELVELDWSEANGMNVEPVNVFVVQAGPDSHILNLGFVTPPVYVGSQREPLTRVHVHVVGRVLLTPESVRALVKGLADNVQKREGAKGVQEAGDES